MWGKDDQKDGRGERRRMKRRMRPFSRASPTPSSPSLPCMPSLTPTFPPRASHATLSGLNVKASRRAEEQRAAAREGDAERYGFGTSSSS